MENLGNQLNRVVSNARASLFNQGEMAQLTYGAFDLAATGLPADDEEDIQITFPVGFTADKKSIDGHRVFKKAQLLHRYQFLAFNQLAINGIIQLVTITEAFLGDIVRLIVMRYPQKLGAKRNVPMRLILESTSIEEIHLRVTETVLNELAYKSPSEYAEAIQPFLSTNLLECPAFHKYVEVKATRDIYIHNRGVANDLYTRKAGSHARVRAGQELPVDVQYFLESYETCLQMLEWLEVKLHEHWHSSNYEEYVQQQMELALSQEPETSEKKIGPEEPQEPEQRQAEQTEDSV